MSRLGNRLFFGGLIVAAAFAAAACVPKGGSSSSNDTPVQSEEFAKPKLRFSNEQPLTTPPVPPAVSGNPLVGAKLFIDPESLAMLNYNRLVHTDPTKARIIEKIATQPQGIWMGEWNTDIFRAVEHFVKRAKAEGSVPVMIAYNIPYRDCGQYSQGGLSSKEAYQRWIRNVAGGIGDDKAVVVLEPDALAHLQECLSPEQKEERYFLLADAVKVLRNLPNVSVYLDSGHPRWQTAEEMAMRLELAGVEYAHGFSVNVSNYVGTDECLDYGRRISSLIGGKHFVIDTSRNGAGPYEEAKTEEETWCNPPDRRIGQSPTTTTGEPLCDGFLWLKRPGESDGECNGGPRAGVWWEPQALELAR